MMRKITKIRGSQHAGILDGWSMPKSVKDLARINVIYGGNGSGKSTLARILSQMHAREPTDTELHATVNDTPGTERQVTDNLDPFWSRLRVFDKQFVDKNLLFDVDGRSDALPLLVLGEPNVRRDQRLAEIDEHLKGFSTPLLAARNAADAAENAAKKLTTDIARTISQELQAAGSRYAGRRYDARRVVEVLSSVGSEACQRSNDEIASDLRIVQGHRLEQLELLRQTEFDLQSIETNVAAVLRQKITNEALESLAGNAAGESWVQQGLGLHEHRDKCLFCAGTISEERRLALANHFDESFKRLQDLLLDLDARLDQERQMLFQVFASAPDPGRVYPDFREQYRARAKDQSKAVEIYSKRIAVLRDVLAQKRDSPFRAQELKDLPDSSVVNFDLINEVLIKHNARSASYEEAIVGAAHRVEQARVASIAVAHGNLLEEVKEQAQLANQLEEKQKRLTEERELTNKTDLDSAPLADELTRDLESLLGRNELVFAKKDARYSILRDGMPATALSEGEKTAISLLYFLCSLREETTRNINAIVVIDDPVSSLDQEILVGVSSHLWSALVGNSSKHQVILLTHSFELFRMWSNQLDRLPSNVRKECSYSIYELRPRYENLADGTVRRRPVMISWTDEKLRKKLRSQYHYLFWRVAYLLETDAGKGDLALEHEANTIIPNAARQMLEAFLSFKHPSKIGDFEGSMRRAFVDKTVPDPLRQRVTRFVHRQSHNEEADISRPVRIGEAITVLRAAFEFINAVDPGHFTEMCSALDLSADRVLAKVGGNE